MENKIKEGEIIDERTGEVIPQGANNIPNPANALTITVNANTVGTLELEPSAVESLSQDLDPADVRIRPDGLVYLPWTWYAHRLNDAFGKLKWGMIPQGAPQSKDTGNNNILIVWGMWLIARGVPISFSMGECSYRSNNKTMSYGDAIEGAKSNALARNCKLLGMALELFDAEWVDTWKKEYAKTIPNPSGGNPEKIWVRKDDTRYANKPAAKSAPKEAPKAPVSKPEKTQEPQGNEIDPDVTFPSVEESKKLSTEYTAKELRGQNNVLEIQQLSGKTIPEVMSAIAAIPAGEKRSIGQIVKVLTGDKDG